MCLLLLSLVNDELKQSRYFVSSYCMLTLYIRAHIFLVFHILHTLAKYEKIQKYWCLFKESNVFWCCGNWNDLLNYNQSLKTICMCGLCYKRLWFFSILKLQSDLYSRIGTLISSCYDFGENEVLFVKIEARILDIWLDTSSFWIKMAQM